MINKKKNIKELSMKDLKIYINDLKKKLFNFRIQHVASQLKNPINIKITRKNIAKAKTILTQKINK